MISSKTVTDMEDVSFPLRSRVGQFNLAALFGKYGVTIHTEHG